MLFAATSNTDAGQRGTCLMRSHDVADPGSWRFMAAQHDVLVRGGTGRTGRHVVEQILQLGAGVRAIVRSARRLPVVVDVAEDRGSRAARVQSSAQT